MASNSILEPDFNSELPDTGPVHSGDLESGQLAFDIAASGDVEEQIRRARDGCTTSLGELYERCRRYLLLIANHELDEDLRAKLGPSDIVQETLCKAQSNFADFEGNSEAKLRGWLRRILLNTAHEARRQYHAGCRDIARERDLQALLTDREPSRPPIGGVETPSRNVMAAEQNAALALALEQLEEHDREIIVLHNLERQTFVQIGVSMGRSAHATRTMWLRAVERLRQLMGNEDGNRQ